MLHRNYISYLQAVLKKHKQAFLFLLLLINLSVVLHFWATYTFPKVRTINLSRARLNVIRAMTKSFNEEKHRYPSSLKELKQYSVAINPDDDVDVWFLEVITNSTGVIKESEVLDGQGGLYYNNKTGELRWNITKPIKYYWKFYYGVGRNDVPSSW